MNTTGNTCNFSTFEFSVVCGTDDSCLKGGSTANPFHVFPLSSF